jgi:CopA family copper-resistance protein
MHTLSRRRFVEGIALTGIAGSLAGAAGAQARPAPASEWPVLQGDHFDLTVGSLAVNFTGRARHATAVNGSVPAPMLRIRQGDTLTIKVTNQLDEPTSIHWHGLLVPSDMDGVPGLSFRGIEPGQSFIYRFPVRQSGTYWYHSHSGMQEQTGLYGPLIIQPRGLDPYACECDYIVMLSDWTDEDPRSVIANLKQQSDYYNYQRRTLSGLGQDVRRQGFRAALADRILWGNMRMSPTDIMDVTGATYTFLLNGQPPASNWTALFKPGEPVRLRFINASSMTTFDVRIPGLTLWVVQADGTDIQPVSVDEFRIGVAETYDVLVTPPAANAYSIFAQAQDRSGYARGTLAPRAGMAAVIPPPDPRPLRTMADMGMNSSGMAMAQMPGMQQMPGMNLAQMPGMDMGVNADGIDPNKLIGQPDVDHIAAAPRSRLAEAGTGLDGNGRRVLTYADLKSLAPNPQAPPPTRELEFHLTGNMERWVWGFNGRKFSQSAAVKVALGERLRFVLINDTMMEHPIHLHGFLTALENGQGEHLPLKHTVNVKPAERLSYLWTADTPGHWAFHCHLLYHMESGMFRTVLVE